MPLLFCCFFWELEVGGHELNSSFPWRRQSTGGLLRSTTAVAGADKLSRGLYIRYWILNTWYICYTDRGMHCYIRAVEYIWAILVTYLTVRSPLQSTLALTFTCVALAASSIYEYVLFSFLLCGKCWQRTREICLYSWLFFLFVSVPFLTINRRLPKLDHFILFYIFLADCSDIFLLNGTVPVRVSSRQERFFSGLTNPRDRKKANAARTYSLLIWCVGLYKNNRPWSPLDAPDWIVWSNQTTRLRVASQLYTRFLSLTPCFFFLFSFRDAFLLLSPLAVFSRVVFVVGVGATGMQIPGVWSGGVGQS